jgi:hypothetical protein
MFSITVMFDPFNLPVLLLMLALCLLTACGTPEVGIEAPSIPAVPATPTVGAFATESEYLNSAEITPSPAPIDTPMPLGSAPTETPWVVTPTPTVSSPTPVKVLTRPVLVPSETPVVNNPLPAVFCRPDEASMTLSASATTLSVGQVITVKITLVNGEMSNVRLGQPQYILHMNPNVFSPDSIEPVETRVTIEPGQSDEIKFVLQATTPGRAALMGVVSYEMHDLEYSWGSWSGCRTEPLDIVVTK